MTPCQCLIFQTDPLPKKRSCQWCISYQNALRVAEENDVSEIRPPQRGILAQAINWRLGCKNIWWDGKSPKQVRPNVQGMGLQVP
jgi:hypothetical protein